MEREYHSFNGHLLESEEGFPLRKEKIYEALEGYTDVRFVKFESEEDKEKQRADIDVLAKAGDVEIGISEKIRNYKYFNDILIEVWSVFERHTHGWLKDSKANYLYCFYSDKLVIVDVYTLKKFCKAFFDEEAVRVMETGFKQLIKERKTSGSIWLKGEKMTLIIGVNKTYHTVSVGVPEEFLVKNGVIIEKIDLKGIC